VVARRRPERVPAAACDALAEGQDSPTLIELATLVGLSADQLARELPELVERVRVELGLVYAGQEDAVRRLALTYAQQTSTG
jgi:hypothetical protein